jgi:hypothetical protein
MESLVGEDADREVDKWECKFSLTELQNMPNSIERFTKVIARSAFQKAEKGQRSRRHIPNVQDIEWPIDINTDGPVTVAGTVLRHRRQI